MITLRIEIFRGEMVWMSRLEVWRAHLGDPTLWEGFGTGAMPTAFGPQVPAHEVKARLQQLNPSARIILLEEARPT